MGKISFRSIGVAAIAALSLFNSSAEARDCHDLVISPQMRCPCRRVSAMCDMGGVTQRVFFQGGGAFDAQYQQLLQLAGSSGTFRRADTFSIPDSASVYGSYDAVSDNVPLRSGATTAATSCRLAEQSSDGTPTPDSRRVEASYGSGWGQRQAVVDTRCPGMAICMLPAICPTTPGRDGPGIATCRARSVRADGSIECPSFAECIASPLTAAPESSSSPAQDFDFPGYGRVHSEPLHPTLRVPNAGCQIGGQQTHLCVASAHWDISGYGAQSATLGCLASGDSCPTIRDCANVAKTSIQDSGISIAPGGPPSGSYDSGPGSTAAEAQ